MQSVCMCVVCVRVYMRVNVYVYVRVSVTTCVVRPDRYQTLRKTSILSFHWSRLNDKCISECALLLLFLFSFFPSSNQVIFHVNWIVIKLEKSMGWVGACVSLLTCIWLLWLTWRILWVSWSTDRQTEKKRKKKTRFSINFLSRYANARKKKKSSTRQ